jgi:hypothetical protein
VRARPGAAALFATMGYETLQRLDFDLADYGVEVEGGKTKTAAFIMRRMPLAKEDSEAKLDWTS